MRNIFEELEEELKKRNYSPVEKMIIIKEAGELYRQKVDKELNDYLAKQRMGAALQIGSVAVPVGGIGKIGGSLSQNILKKQIGRKISENIGNGALSGAISGGVFGAGKGLSDETNPILSSLEGTVNGVIAGATLGSIGGNIQKTVKGQKLKQYGDIDTINDNLRKQYNKDAREFYQDYIQEIKLNKNGNLDFTKRGVQEQLRWNPKQAQNFPELINDIQNSQKLPDVPNLKPLEKPQISHYEVYRGKSGDHLVEVSKNGKRRYYMTKDTLDGSSHTTSTASTESIGTESPNKILKDFDVNYNPQSGNKLLHGHIEVNIDRNNNPTGYAAPNIQQENKRRDLKGYLNPLTKDNRIYTAEDIGEFSRKEFSKREPEIDAQINSIGIPRRKDLSVFGGGTIYIAPYTRSDGVKVKGHYRAMR